MHAKICLVAQEKHLNSQNKSLADSFNLPATITNYDKDTLLATIIRRYSTLPVLYDDTDWFYDECSLWWDENKYAFQKMWEAWEKEYNPIENYDRTETRTGASTTIGNNSSEKSFSQSIDGEAHKTGTETTVLDGETKGTGTVTDAHTGTDTIGTQQATSGSTENKVSAYNESTYEPSRKIEESGSLNSTVIDTKNLQDQQTRNTKDEMDSTTTVTHNTTDTNDVDTTSSETIEGTDSSTTNDSYSLRARGNIGVTTSQQMVESEIQLRKKYNLYKIMANTFADDMCLGIW